jgi:hypothetical protein
MKAIAKGKLSQNLQEWIKARTRHHLSHAHVQMARELGMNPKKLGKIDNHRQEPWKAPLPIFIEDLYFKRFGKERPDVVLSIEEIAKKQEEKKAAKREAKLLRADSRIGTIEKGKEATILIVDGNPLQDVRSLSAVSTVFMKGERVNRTALLQEK